MRSREGSRSRRSPRAAIYALIVLTDGLHIAIVPLLPRFAGRFSLGGVAAGALLAGPGVAMALVSLPGGRLVDRFEPRRVAVCSAVALAIAAAGQAAAPTFAVLMGARLLGGLAMGLAWISAAAWIVRVVAPEDSARALGALVTAAGAGIVGGPVVAGLTAQWLGTAAPFLLIATASAVVAGRLATADPGVERHPDRHDGSDRKLAAALADPGVAAAALGLGLSAFASSALGVAVPLALHANGVSEASTGVLFAVSTGAFMAASTVATRSGARMATFAVLSWTLVALALTPTPAAVWNGTVAIAAALILSGPFRGIASTTSLPIASASAERAAVRTGAAMGVLNASWALNTVLGPLLAGVLVDWLQARAVFLVLELAMLAGAAAALVLARRALGTSLQGRRPDLTGGAAP